MDHKTFFRLFILLLPTQLTLHFWPGQSFLLGIRSDYLSPAFYATDIVFVLSFALWIINTKPRLPLLFFVVLIFAAINTLVSPIALVTFYKWLRIFQFAILVWFVKRNKKEIWSLITKPLLVGLLFTLFLSVLQIISKSSFGWLFYWFGERSFTTSTPGIATYLWKGEKYLRAYATFPHPNVLAGFTTVASLLVVRYTKPSGKVLILFCLLVLLALARSEGALLGVLIITSIHLLFKNSARVLKAFILSVFFLSLLLPLLINFVPDNLLTIESLSIRKSLLLSAGQVFIKSPVVGTGLGALLVFQQKIKNINELFLAEPIFRFQPVHNVFVLLLVEIGIIGVVLSFLLIFRNIIKSNDKLLLSCILFIFVTGFFDHYWVSIHQTFLLSGIVLGLMLQ